MPWWYSLVNFTYGGDVVNLKSRELIKGTMRDLKVDARDLAVVTDIKPLRILMLLHCPFVKPKLCQTAAICEALNIDINNFFDRHFDRHSKRQTSIRYRTETGNQRIKFDRFRKHRKMATLENK